jgi:hypothetical protein
MINHKLLSIYVDTAHKRGKIFGLCLTSRGPGVRILNAHQDMKLLEVNKRQKFQLKDKNRVNQ